MPTRPADVLAHLRSPEGVKLLRYSAASIVSLAVSVVCLVVFEGVFRWGAVVSSTLATAIATVPSYELNRKWAWGKTGQGHLWREVVPFWITAFIGWGFSTLCVAGAAHWGSDHHLSHLVHTALVAFVYVAAFGVLWIGKFVFFNKVLFAHTELHDARAGSGAAGAAAGVLE